MLYSSESHIIPSMPMEPLSPRLITITITLLFLAWSTISEDDDVKTSLIDFLNKLSNNRDVGLGWKEDTDPCEGQWRGITCNNRTNTLRSIVLEGLGFNGSIDASILCIKVPSVVILSFANNNLRGPIPTEIGNCSRLTHLYLSHNQLSGSLPSSLSRLRNLKRLDLSKNNFSGELPDLSRITGLVSFAAEDNQIEGTIPRFDFANLKQFNVSNNLFNGDIPEGGSLFNFSSFSGNPGLCGAPVPTACAPAPSPKAKSKSKTAEHAIMYSGYIILSLVFVIFIVYKIVKATRNKGSNDGCGDLESKSKRKSKTRESSGKVSSVTSDTKTVASRSEYSIASSHESTPISTSLIVMKNPMAEELRFEDLLKAPAEMVARGRFGSLYKVLFENEITLAVKRIKDYTVSAPEFGRRMERMDRLSHPNVLPAVAFYCSKQEKLVVYEYQQNGSLFSMIHGSQESLNFDWSSRLSVAGNIAEGLSYMHGELQEQEFGHGNLKSSNILMDSNMEPCISEYGLMDSSKLRTPDLKDRTRVTGEGLKIDVYSFGIILLELLTGKLVHNNGFDLPKWVNSVVREEWTAEVFDRTLTADGSSEERMVHLLQVALKCIDAAPDNRPSMREVAKMINSIKEEDDKSSVYEV